MVAGMNREETAAEVNREETVAEVNREETDEETAEESLTETVKIMKRNAETANITENMVKN